MDSKRSNARALAVPTGRLSRFGRLGSMTAGVAGSMALNGLQQLGQGQRPVMRDLLFTPSNITRVADQLAKMRGAAMKIGQLMSMDTGDVLPPELAQIMARLRDDAHFMPPAQLKRVLNEAWPENWLREFKSFDVRPVAAASIGQVHRAVLRSGEELAIKVQYPGVADSIDSDVANVGVLMRMSGLLPRGFDLGPYLEEARKQLHEETDYQREGAHLCRFGNLLQRAPQFEVPTLHSGWSTMNILAMSFVSAQPIEEVRDAPHPVRDRIARDLIELTMRELFSFGLMQTDPNFANYLFDPDTNRIALLDFGAAREIDPVVIDQYRRLLEAGIADDRSALSEIIEEIGFVGAASASRHRAQIVDMICTVFNALRATTPFDFSDTKLSRVMQAKGTALAEDGFVPPPLPVDVLLVQRKLGGVFLLAARLGARVDVLEVIAQYLGRVADRKRSA
ncbi:MAG: AarF/ABC1/UbiB kinase family protein [Boseongicola sp.]|nr:AarF/ABC1/UbiB kinase family protein [Boseongicola sp.]